MIKRILAYINSFLPQILEEPSQIVNTSKDKKDKRDLIYVSSNPELASSHTIIDLPPIRQQGTIGSCASHAAIGCYEIQLPKKKYLEGSELFHYYNTRVHINNTFPKDKGMTIRDSCKALKEYGFAFEFLCPYQTSKFNDRPSKMAYYFSKLYKIEKYERILSIDNVKSSLMKNIPVECGICVNSNFYKLNRDNYLYNPSNRTIYGHGVIIVGYNNAKGVFIMRNSWGTGFGNKGYFEMTYKSFINTSFDWWRIIIKGGR